MAGTANGSQEQQRVFHLAGLVRPHGGFEFGVTHNPALKQESEPSFNMEARYPPTSRSNVLALP